MASADFIVRRPDGQVILIAEAKNKRHTNAEWATQVRRNLLAHFRLQAPYFLLATPDRLYFWIAGATADAVPPSAEMDAGEVLLPYIRSAGIESEHLSGATFELVVSSWLRELLGKPPAAAAAPYPPSLHQSGFFDALRGSFIEHRATA